MAATCILLFKMFKGLNVTVNYVICSTLYLAFYGDQKDLKVKLLHLIPLALSSFTATTKLKFHFNVFQCFTKL